MPAVSKAQFRAMQAAAHGRGTKDIPASVGRDFVDSTPNPSDLPERKAAGGLVRARTKGQVVRNKGGLVSKKTPGPQIRNRGGIVQAQETAPAVAPGRAFVAGGLAKARTSGQEIQNKRMGGKVHHRRGGGRIGNPSIPSDPTRPSLPDLTPRAPTEPRRLFRGPRRDRKRGPLHEFVIAT